MNWLSQHVGSVGAAGGGTLAIVGLAFKDVFREWWRDYHAERQEERQHRINSQNGGALAHELIGILKQQVQENLTQIKDLNTTLKALTSAIEHLATITDSSHRLLSETRDNVIELKGRVH